MSDLQLIYCVTQSVLLVETSCLQGLIRSQSYCY
jgi:hypothetical protein